MIPDPTSGNFLITIIAAGAGIVMSIYFIQVWLWPMIQGLSGGTESAARERVYDLMNQYYKQNQEVESEIRGLSMTSPRLQMIKAAQQEEKVTCLLVNRGGTASNLQIRSKATSSASINPVDALENGQTGSISLHSFDKTDDLDFELTYEDPLGMRVTRQYVFSKQDNNFIEN